MAQEKRVYQTARLITEAPVIDGLLEDDALKISEGGEGVNKLMAREIVLFG